MQPDTQYHALNNFGPHVQTNTRTVLHWLQTGGAQNARKFPINLHTRTHSVQRKTRLHSHKCDSKVSAQYQLRYYLKSLHFISFFTRPDDATTFFSCNAAIRKKNTVSSMTTLTWRFSTRDTTVYSDHQGPIRLTSYTVPIFPFLIKQRAGMFGPQIGSTVSSAFCSWTCGTFLPFGLLHPTDFPHLYQNTLWDSSDTDWTTARLLPVRTITDAIKRFATLSSAL